MAAGSSKVGAVGSSEVEPGQLVAARSEPLAAAGWTPWQQHGRYLRCRRYWCSCWRRAGSSEVEPLATARPVPALALMAQLLAAGKLVQTLQQLVPRQTRSAQSS